MEAIDNPWFICGQRWERDRNERLKRSFRTIEFYFGYAK
jgi:hypothetical protein